ncbi:MAG: RNA helicase [Hangzhou dicistrovirus 1]|nr:MAG: RNA helicase [Hangzhou dicistrovirus 1]
MGLYKEHYLVTIWMHLLLLALVYYSQLFSYGFVVLQVHVFKVVEALSSPYHGENLAVLRFISIMNCNKKNTTVPTPYLREIRALNEARFSPFRKISNDNLSTFLEKYWYYKYKFMTIEDTEEVDILYNIDYIVCNRIYGAEELFYNNTQDHGYLLTQEIQLDVVKRFIENPTETEHMLVNWLYRVYLKLEGMLTRKPYLTYKVWRKYASYIAFLLASIELGKTWPLLDYQWLFLNLHRRNHKYFIKVLLRRNYLDRFCADTMAHWIATEVTNLSALQCNSAYLSRFQAQSGMSSSYEQLIEAIDDLLKFKEQGLLNFSHDLGDKSFNKLSGLINQVLAQISGQMSDGISQIGIKLLKVLAIIMLMWLLYQHYLKSLNGGVSVALSIIGLITTIAIPSDWLLGKASTVSQAIAKFRSQGLSDDDESSVRDMFSSIPLMLVNALSDNIKPIWNSRQLDLLLKRVSYFGDNKISKGLLGISDFLKSFVKLLTNWFKYLLGLPQDIDLSMENSPLDIWFDRVKEVISQIQTQRIAVTETTLAHMSELYSQGITLSRAPIYSAEKSTIMGLCLMLVKGIEKIGANICQSGSVRNPPVCLYLYGETGVGKSSLTYPLSLAIVGKILKKENSPLLSQLNTLWKEMVYVRASEQEFWDGYSGQLITLFDDFNQQVDSVGNPSSELFEIIRASNVFPYPLHMAHLEDKANTYFSSKIIIASSNNKTPKVQSLNYPQALNRRFNVNVEVLRKENDGSFNIDDYSFVEAGGNILTFEQLADKCVDQYFVGDQFVKSMNDFMTEYISTYFTPQGLLVDAVRSFAVDKVLNTVDELAFTEEQLSAINRKSERLNYFKQMKVQYPWLGKLATTLAWISFTASVIGLCYGLYQYIKPSEKVKQPKHVEHDITVSESYTEIKQGVPKIESYTEKQNAIQKISSEGVCDLSSVEVMERILKKSVYKMIIQNSDVIIGHCLFVVGRTALIPYHYKRGLDQYFKTSGDFVIEFVNSSGCKIFSNYYSDLKIVPFESNETVREQVSRDLALVIVPSAYTHASLKPYLVSKREITTLHLASVMLPLIKKDGDRFVLCMKYMEGNSKCSYKTNLPVFDETGQHVDRLVRDGWTYFMDTVKTDCGAPLIIRNSRVTSGKVIGVHVAGANGTGLGFSTALYKEDFDSFVQLFPQSFEYAPELSFPESSVLENLQFDEIGQLEKPIFSPSKSNIVPSLVYGEITEPKTRTCLLHKAVVNGEEFSPRDYRIRRLGKFIPAVKTSDVQVAKRVVFHELKRVIAPYRTQFQCKYEGKYSFADAVRGIDGLEFVNSIKRTTSAGFPFVQEGTKRKDIFGEEDQYDLDTPLCLKLKERCEFIETKAREGIQLDHYFIDTLKDERKSKEKSHKTRLFSAGALDYLIVCKQYFNGIVAVLEELRNHCHISVGTNVYSTDWDDIAKNLLAKSNYLGAGDFEGFDASQSAEILRAASEILIDLSMYVFENEEDAIVMQVLLESLLSSHHISEGTVYRWVKSLPSGHYLTAIINSLFVLISTILAFGYCTGNMSFYHLLKFFENGNVVAYGDDHVIAFPKQYIELFNEISIVEAMSRLGLTYTNEAKSGVSEVFYRTIEEVSYLKRRFVFDCTVNRYIAPLSLDTVLESPMWIHKCVDRTMQTIVNIENSLRELSLHSVEIWNDWAPKLLHLCTQLGVESKFSDWYDTRTLVLDMSLARS